MLTGLLLVVRTDKIGKDKAQRVVSPFCTILHADETSC